MGTGTLIKSLIHIKLNERKSREEILNLREKKFRKILKYAYKNSKFYHDLYKKNGIKTCDLDTIPIEKLPIINKDIVMDNYDEILTDNNVSKNEVIEFIDKNKNPNDLFKGKYHILHTSGSSGKIGIFVYSRRDWDSFYPTITRAFYFNPLKRNKSVFFGSADGHYSGVSFSSWGGRGLTALFNKPLILDIKKPINYHIKKLNEFQPDILGGYFIGLKILAEQQEKGLLDIHPNTLVNCGEGITPREKDYIESIFKVKMNNIYGVAECSVLGVGKDEYGGIALFDDIALIEIKEDHIIFTNLFNKTQPLIRYQIDDYLKEKKDASKDFPFTLVEDVIGRKELVIWLKNKYGKKDFIHPLLMTDFYVKGLDKLQIVQTSDTSFIFRAVIIDLNREEVIEKIKEKLNNLLASKDFTNVTYSIEVVDHLSIDPKIGKFKLVIKEGY